MRHAAHRIQQELPKRFYHQNAHPHRGTAQHYTVISCPDEIFQCGAVFSPQDIKQALPGTCRTG